MAKDYLVQIFWDKIVIIPSPPVSSFVPLVGTEEIHRLMHLIITTTLGSCNLRR